MEERCCGSGRQTDSTVASGQAGDQRLLEFPTFKPYSLSLPRNHTKLHAMVQLEASPVNEYTGLYEPTSTSNLTG